MAKDITVVACMRSPGHTETLKRPLPRSCGGHCACTYRPTLEPTTVSSCQPPLPLAPSNVTCQLCLVSARPTWCGHWAELDRRGVVQEMALCPVGWAGCCGSPSRCAAPPPKEGRMRPQDPSCALQPAIVSTGSAGNFLRRKVLGWKSFEKL